MGAPGFPGDLGGVGAPGFPGDLGGVGAPGVPGSPEASLFRINMLQNKIRFQATICLLKISISSHAP